MSSDGSLLNEYAQSGSEVAFTELVQRHLDLVYSTALRGVGGDEHLAKDVSQSVFLDLARKAAGLSNRPILAGWLYTSTCFAASKAVRSERRRKTREQEAQHMQNQVTEPVRDSDWEQVSPVLNTAMLELKESDREALLLRFFEQRSLGAVGNKLGLSENAARMRVERALERLRDRLMRRGIRSTAAGLALALGHQALVAAPIGLAASITAASLAGAAATSGLSILNLVIMSKAKTVLVGAAISAGVLTPIVLQHEANNRLKSEIQELRTQLTGTTTPPRPAANPSELDRLRREHEELLRLRGEVTLLRQQAANSTKALDDVRQGNRTKAMSKTDTEIEADDSKELLAKSPEIPMIPARTWVNAGTATPAAALQTLNWAGVSRDTNALLRSLSLDPKARELADETFAALPAPIRDKYGSVDGILLDWMLNLAPPPAAYRVLSQTEQGPDDYTLTVQFQYEEGRVRENPVQFYRDETGNWRRVIPTEVMEKLPHVINSLAQSPGAAGK